MELKDFFYPIHITGLILFLLTFMSFEISGFFIARLIKAPDFLRPSFWVFGIGIWVFTWFILHFFIPLDRNLILVSLAVLALLPLRSYLVNKSYKSLFSVFISNKWILPSLLIILPFVIFKSSLPPYHWDEIAYHYYSPAKLLSSTTWDFSYQVDPNIPGYYENLPRFFESAFILLFAASYDYFSARMLQLILLISTLLSGALFFKKYISKLSAMYFYYTSLFFSYVFVYSTLSGYIDVGVASFVLLSVLATLHLLVSKDFTTLISVSALSGLALGSKYTAISPFIANSLSYLLTSFPYSSPKKLFNKKLATKFAVIIFLVIIMLCLYGGYWYIKNYILTKNPVYPFIIPCQIERCYDQIPESSEWLHAVDFSIFPRIYREVFFENIYFTILFFISPILCFLHPNKNIRKFSLFLIVLFLIELGLLFKVQSGFSIRYFTYYYFLITLFVSLPGIIIPKFKTRLGKLVFAYWTFALITSLTLIIPSITELYSPRLFRKVDIKYTLRIMDLQQWNEYYFPKLHRVVSWCGQDHPMVDLYVFDPGLIWDSGESLFKGLLVNCNMKTPSTHNKSKDQLIEELSKKQPFYIATIYQCGQKDYPTYADDRVTKTLNEINQDLICKSEKITDHLYYYNPTKQ